MNALGIAGLRYVAILCYIVFLFPGTLALPECALVAVRATCSASDFCVGALMHIWSDDVLRWHIQRLVGQIALHHGADDDDLGLRLCAEPAGTLLHKSVVELLMAYPLCPVNEQYNAASRQCVCRPGAICDARDVCNIQYSFGAFYFALTVLLLAVLVSSACMVGHTRVSGRSA